MSCLEDYAKVHMPCPTEYANVHVPRPAESAKARVPSLEEPGKQGAVSGAGLVPPGSFPLGSLPLGLATEVWWVLRGARTCTAYVTMSPSATDASAAPVPEALSTAPATHKPRYVG